MSSCACHAQNAANAPSCLAHVPVFAQLHEAEVELLHSVMRTSQYHKGETIFREGDLSDALFVVNRGIIKLTKLEDNGKEHIIRLLFPGDFFGQFALLQEKPHYASAIAADSTGVCRIHRSDFLDILRRDPDTAARFMTALSTQLEEADAWAAVLTLLEADRRLAKMLLYFHRKAAPDSQEFALPVSKKELAGLIGATPETLSRKLRQLSDDGVLTVSGRQLLLRDEAALRHLAGEA